MLSPYFDIGFCALRAISVLSNSFAFQKKIAAARKIADADAAIFLSPMPKRF
jgi:hypothetical protein